MLTGSTDGTEHWCRNQPDLTYVFIDAQMQVL